MQAWRGRLLTEADDKPSAPPAAVITWRYWQRRLSGDPSVIGTAVTINNVAFTIVGVTPPEFVGAQQVGLAADVSIPLSTELLAEAPNPTLRQPADWWLLIKGGGSNLVSRASRPGPACRRFISRACWMRWMQL